MDQTFSSQTNRISPEVRHDHAHRRHMIVWTLLVALILIIVAVIAWKRYEAQKLAAFNVYYNQMQQQANQQFLDQVAKAKGAPMTDAQKKAFIAQSAAVSAQTPTSDAVKKAFLDRVNAKNQADRAAA